MKRVGIIGLGEMGIAMARNIVQSGFELTGYDLREERRAMLEADGGTPAASVAEVGASSDVVVVMVMNGSQVREVVCGDGGLLSVLEPGAAIIVSATIEPDEIRELAAVVAERGIGLVDSPVSGGKSGAEAGTLTLMTAAKADVFEAHQDVLQAVGEKIFHVGEDVGIGQTVKASLQALIGATFTAIFESLVLGVKAGVEGRVLYDVFTSSGVGSPLLANCAKLILDREFKDTGSHIGTMFKDLGISMSLARKSGAAMFTASAAYELFQSGISLFPEEDNWSIVKLLEQIAGTEVTWE